MNTLTQWRRLICFGIATAGYVASFQAQACPVVAPSVNIDSHPPEHAAREIYKSSAFIAEAIVVGDDPWAQWLFIKHVYKGGRVYFPLIRLTTGLPCGPFISGGDVGIIASATSPLAVMDFPGWLSARQINVMRSEKLIR